MNPLRPKIQHHVPDPHREAINICEKRKGDLGREKKGGEKEMEKGMICIAFVSLPKKHCTAAQVKDKLNIQVIKEVGGGQPDSGSRLRLSGWVLDHLLRE